MGTLKTTKNMIGIAGFLFFIASLIGISVWMLENQSAETIKTGACGITKKSSNQS